VATRYSPELIAGTLALYYASNGSINAKVPIQAARSKLSEPYRSYTKSIMKKVRKAGFCNVYPRRKTVYSINVSGIKFLKSMGLI
jgi:hypothetical protein